MHIIERKRRIYTNKHVVLLLLNITLRSSRVSEAIRPLLGKPRRISALSLGFASTLPLTTVTEGDKEQHETENLTEKLRVPSEE